MNYPSDMDKECIVLCDAINSIPGLHTIESCCGHGKDVFKIYLIAETVNSLYLLTKSIDQRYGGPLTKDLEIWKCNAYDVDVDENFVRFVLESPTMGDEQLTLNLHNLTQS